MLSSTGPVAAALVANVQELCFELTVALLALVAYSRSDIGLPVYHIVRSKKNASRELVRQAALSSLGALFAFLRRPPGARPHGAGVLGRAGIDWAPECLDPMSGLHVPLEVVDFPQFEIVGHKYALTEFENLGHEFGPRSCTSFRDSRPSSSTRFAISSASNLPN